MKTTRLAVLLIAALPLAVAAHEEEPGKVRLGKVSFPSSCDVKVQPTLERAVAMLHSFWYSAAEKTFEEVLAADPQCAIATWGIAAILMNNPLAGQGATPQAAVKAQGAIDQGRRIGARTERERDYIEAVADYYRDFATRAERDRQLTRAKAFEALAAKYPQDDEAQIFSALYTAGTQTQADQSYAAYLKAAGILEGQFAKYPDHPGVAHYLIHSYDAPPIAGKGLTAARRYAGIAPDAPHALHMPSHIFTRVGAWEESAATNARSAEVARAQGDDESYHAADYMVYAYLQMARDDEARATVERALKEAISTPRFIAPYAAAAMPARYAVERGDWRAAAGLKLVPSSFPFADAMTVYARALGAARTGDVAGAKAEAAQLETLHKKLLEAKNNYWASEVEVQRLGASGWIALAEGNRAEALKFMRGAADLEDQREKHIVTPGRLLPARELLGEMLLEVNEPQAALKELETAQAREPNRFRSLYLSAVAAEAAGDSAKARDYYQRVAVLAKDGGARPELARVKQRLAQR